jgi:hypothetical protein
LKGGHKTEVVKLRGQWVEVDPATWRKRSDFKISVGFASGNKDAMIGRLQMIRAGQMEAMQLGLPHVKPENVYETDIELVKAADFATPERFYTDPSKAEPQPQQPNPDMLRLQGEMTAKQAELEQMGEFKQSEMAMNQQKAQTDAELKSRELEQKAALEKYRIDTDAQVKLQLAAMQSEAAHSLETHKSNTALAKQDRMKIDNIDKLDEIVDGIEEIAKSNAEQSQTLAQAMMQTMQMLAAAVEKMNAPRIPVRDQSGRIVRVDVG